MADSENVRRALGVNPDIRPLETEPGNIWPGPTPPEPTLGDINKVPPEGTVPSTAVPGERPGLPDHREPRPLRRGSSTPPGNAQPGLPSLRNPPPFAAPPGPAARPPRQGQVVPTPQGPAVDAGGTDRYRELTTPRGPGAIIVPNGNGTSTVINPDGSVQTIPTPR